MEIKKEELTTEMHNEFKISEETEKKHKVLDAIKLTNNEKEAIQLLRKWGLTENDFTEFKKTNK